MKEIKKKKGKRRWTRDDTDLTLISLPTFIWFVLFSYLPMFGIIIAFKDYKLSPGHGFIYNLLHSDWVGWSNFTYFFKSNAFWMLLRNTIVYNLVFIALGAAVAVGFALMLSNLRNKLASKAYQTMMFFPYFMSWVVISYIVYAVLTPEKGYLNNIIVALGGTKIMWYQEPKYWPFILTFLRIWKGMGYGMVIYLATITGIDPSLYEAAVMDGATKWQQTKHITMPCIKPVLIMMLILDAGKSFILILVCFIRQRVEYRRPCTTLHLHLIHIFTKQSSRAHQLERQQRLHSSSLYAVVQLFCLQTGW